MGLKVHTQSFPGSEASHMLITGRGEGATVLPLTQDTQGSYITRIIRISRYVYRHPCMHPLSNKIPRAASCMSHNIVNIFHFTCSLESRMASFTYIKNRYFNDKERFEYAWINYPT